MSEPDVGKPQIALIHIGAPKTATTTLQGWLRTNRKRLSNRGVGLYLPRMVRQHKYLGGFQNYFRGVHETPNTSSFLSLFKDEKNKKIILSEEALTNDFIPGANNGGRGFSVVDRTIDFIKALEMPDLRVLLTVRRQDKFLKSAYSHRVRRSAVTTSFEEWMATEVQIEDMSWLRAVDALDAAFGAENVTVVPFEMLEGATDKDFYLRCVSPLGMDFKRHVAPKQLDANSALAEQTLRIAGILNALEAEDPEEVDRRRKLITQINQFVLDNGGQSFKVDMVPVTERTRALYQSENAELEARKFPDLKTSFAYPEA